MNTLKLRIGGMHCDSCANRIRLLLDKEPGIREATVSWEAGTGQIGYESHATSEERIVELIEGADFTVERG